MPALHPATAFRAGADLHPELTRHNPRNRQLFLKLRRHPRRLDGSSAVRARRRQRSVMAFIDPGGPRTPRRDAVVCSRTAAGTFRIAGERLGERRRLPAARPTRRRQLPLQPRILLLQPLIPLLQTHILSWQPIPYPFRPLQDSAPILDTLAPLLLPGRLCSGTTLHTPFMSDPSKKYKSNPLDRPAEPANQLPPTYLPVRGLA